MKILMTADAVGGVWTYALELSAALARHDVSVILATMGPQPSRAQRNSAATLTNLQLECSMYRLEWMENPWRDVQQAGDWLQGIAARENVEVIHLNGYAHAALPWPRPVIAVAHSCVCSWWQAVHGSAPPSEWDAYRRKVADGLNHADHIVAPTNAFLEEIRRWYRPSKPASVIHNGRSCTGCAPVAPRGRLPVIFACGRLWDEAKGMRVLDAAAQGLAWPAYVAGPATAPDGRHTSLKTLRHLGSLPPRDVAAWMRRAAIFVHPSHYEPFGLAVLEAARGGCALVLADLPGLRELWNGAAVFVDTADAIALRRALQMLIADPQRRMDLSDAARSRARRYRSGIMAKAYMNLYRKLCASVQARERAVA